MPCQGRPAVPRGSPCPKSPAQGCQQRGHVNLAASRCLSVPPLRAGVVAATHFPLHGAPGVTPQGCPGLPAPCPLPAWLNTARPIPPALGGGLVLLTWPGRPQTSVRIHRGWDSQGHIWAALWHTAAAHPPVPPWALLLPHDPLPRLLHAVSPLQVLGPRGMQHPPQHPPGRCFTLGPWVSVRAPLAPATAGGEAPQPPSCMGRAPGSPACTRDWEPLGTGRHPGEGRVTQAGSAWMGTGWKGLGCR